MTIKFFKVTWYSKLGAILLFLLAVPLLAFCIGIQYEQARQANVPVPIMTLPSTEKAATTLPKTASASINGFPVTISIDECVDIKNESQCFGSGATVNTTVKSLKVWDRVSTSDMISLGVNDGIKLYGVGVDFGNHEYTKKEYDLAVSSVVQKYFLKEK
jgi:hypothetical protein